MAAGSGIRTQATTKASCYSAILVTDWLKIPQPLSLSRWSFPPADDWPDSDLIATGADLDPSTIVTAYRKGLFPMTVEVPDPVVGWWSPDPRGILPLEGLRVTRSLRASAKRFDVRVNTCLGDVIRGCANPSRPHGWITPAFTSAYTALHALGWVHSVEVFDRAGQLAGGLYGVRIGGLFSGESMFSVQRDASKVALVGLVELMRSSGMALLDVQWCTDHLASLGAVEVPRREYLRLLARAVSGTRVA
jgi:leucyl/phenylalanyl-tRNA--protein transferase